MLLGAVIGDMVGSRFEFDNYRTTDFEWLTDECVFTDDTVSVAVAQWLRDGGDLADMMRHWCYRYPAGYGDGFFRWLHGHDQSPYNSFGNGSTMRVSPVGWLFDSLQETLDYAEKSAEITHNHPEGIKGAQAVAAAIFWARTGQDKEFIKREIEARFGYDLSATCDEIRPEYEFNETCQGTVPQAIIAFLESEDFEHAIRLAVSLGGDSDTLAAITGSIAEAFYGIPEAMQKEAVTRLPAEMAAVLAYFHTDRIR